MSNTAKSWIGTVGVFVLLGIFGLYVRSHEITTAVGIVFGGGLLFCGILIDPAEFRPILGMIKRSPE